MPVKKLPFAFLILLMLSFSSCSVFQKSSRQKMEKKEAADNRSAEAEMKKIEKAHFKKQSPETKKMMKRSKKHSKKLLKRKKR